MAEVLVQISGVLYDKLSRTERPVLLQGMASLVGLGVGGGPIVPGGDPPHIWGGGNEPFPTPPIANVPGAPGYRPPLGIWGGGNVPMPSPPIANVPGLPPMPDEPPPEGPPDQDGFIKPPPPQGGWAYHQTYGWMLDPAPTQGTPHSG